MRKRELKKTSTSFIKRLLNQDYRYLIIQAGAPIHKSPHLYQWLWVGMKLPFLPEDTLNEYRCQHGKDRQSLYQILVSYPLSIEKMVSLLVMNLFEELLEEFYNSNESFIRSNRIQSCVDDTKSEKYGQKHGIYPQTLCELQKAIHKWFYSMFVIVASGTYFSIVCELKATQASCQTSFKKRYANRFY